ncbi:uncharacterized protein LOC128982825 isoform X3 [Macrosteles quadrilineatus]|uniref:uncharacterized protein LOC128982825 isoform X3 n=1 Tax=Macrosteles quadrilineatus TaxID=74068 RepID=UPI0023E1954D|nr:uncharacterized protein LOC128982825 isoform X3 [Macrosteles quadrilineatus]
MQRKESSFKRAGPTESDYNQLLLEAREKCLPLMKRVVKKYPEYKKICISIEEKRPPVKWLKKLKAICRKIEDGISEKSNETQDKNGRKSRKDSNATLVK